MCFEVCVHVYLCVIGKRHCNTRARVRLRAPANFNFVEMLNQTDITSLKYGQPKVMIIYPVQVDFADLPMLRSKFRAYIVRVMNLRESVRH